MRPEIFEEWLRDAWQLGIGAFFGYLIIDQFWRIVFKHFAVSPLKGIVTSLMIGSCLIWALSFINVTYIERWALGVAFADYDKPPISFLHISLAIIFGVLFAVLVSNGWRLAVVIPLALGLAVADILGNSALIAGVEQMARRAEAAGTPFQAPQWAWHAYYTEKPHLLRISAYAATLTAAMIFFLISLVFFYKDNPKAARAAGPERVEGAAYLSFRYLASLIFCVALIGNLVVIWSWRLERECALSRHQMSFIYSDPEQCAAPAPR